MYVFWNILDISGLSAYYSSANDWIDWHFNSATSEICASEAAGKDLLHSVFVFSLNHANTTFKPGCKAWQSINTSINKNWLL